MEDAPSPQIGAPGGGTGWHRVDRPGPAGRGAPGPPLGRYSRPATFATNLATSWASLPWRISEGIVPWPRQVCAEPGDVGFWRQPLSTVCNTSVAEGRIVSRFGPTLPTAFAAASVWQTAQC